MRTLAMPNGQKPSQDELLRRIAQRRDEGCVGHVRVLAVHDTDVWLPSCGRIDVAHSVDAPLVGTRPTAGARLLEETLPLDDLAKRLSAAFAGGPFVVSGEPLGDHGLDSMWSGLRYTDKWSEYGVPWPVIELVPSNGVGRQPYIHDVYPAEGEVEALDGVLDCARICLGYLGIVDPRDLRARRFGIYEWDYRGVVRTKSVEGSLALEVEPARDPALVLSIVAYDDGGTRRKSFPAPADVAVPLAGALRRVNITLRRANDIVCELTWSEATERLRLAYDGRYERPPVSPQADPIDAGSAIAEGLLPFMADKVLARMVARDLAELESAMGAGNVKSAMLLAGSILEATLLDVLGRNEPIARQRLAKKWPDRASATDLIKTASAINVLNHDGTVRPLLPALTAKKGDLLVDHRDLIHPRAEIRSAATMDVHAAQTMNAILAEVLRDLRDAHLSGALDEYAVGKIA